MGTVMGVSSTDRNGSLYGRTQLFRPPAAPLSLLCSRLHYALRLMLAFSLLFRQSPLSSGFLGHPQVLRDKAKTEGIPGHTFLVRRRGTRVSAERVKTCLLNCQDLLD